MCYLYAPLTNIYYIPILISLLTIYWIMYCRRIYYCHTLYICYRVGGNLYFLIIYYEILIFGIRRFYTAIVVYKEKNKNPLSIKWYIEYVQLFVGETRIWNKKKKQLPRVYLIMIAISVSSKQQGALSNFQIATWSSLFPWDAYSLVGPRCQKKKIEAARKN